MKYVINHNTLINSISEVIEVDETFIKKNKIKISYIGSIRDLKINLDFIEALKNSKRFVLVYNGEGIVNQAVEAKGQSPSNHGENACQVNPVPDFVFQSQGDKDTDQYVSD